MTVTAASPVVRYTYSAPGSFAFTFRVIAETDLVVTLTTSGVATTLVLGVDYLVDLNEGGLGGTVRMYTVGSGTLEILRDIPFTQEVDWQNHGPLDAETLEDCFDRTVMLIQQINATLLGELAVSRWRGNWVTATEYSPGDVVWVAADEIFYACNTVHTSGTFATDYANGLWFVALDVGAMYEAAIAAEVTAEVADQLAAKADLASPTFTGVPAAPTAAAGTNTTQIATTAFVQEAASPVAEPVTGLNAEGALMGFDVTVSANTLTVGKGSCLDTELAVHIEFTADKTCVIPATVNQEFFVFAVRLLDGITFEARSYTTLAGPESDAQIDAWRLISWCLNNGSGVVMPYKQVDGRIEWLSIGSMPVLTSSLSGSLTSYDISAVVPIEVLETIVLVPFTPAAQSTGISFDGSTTVWSIYAVVGSFEMAALPGVYISGSATHAVKFRSITLRR